MRHRTVLFLVAVVCFLFLLAGNSLLPVTDPVESNYALTAKEMVLSGDWISPQIYGTYWYDKPIFLYWLLCLSYAVFGFTDFAARLPSALFGTLSVIIAVWYMLRRYQRVWPALLLAAMTITSLEVWAVSHSIITDQMLFAFTAATMFFAYIGLTEGKKNFVIAAYASAALSVLTKGPVGIVLPGLFLLIFIALRRNTTYLKRLFPPAGILLFCIISLSWYGTMYVRHGMDFINGFLGLNNVVRATVSEHPQYNVWYYYVILVPLSLLPWTGPCLYGLWKRRGWNDEYVYMAVWAVGTILFYTCMATKYPTYAYITNMPLLFLGAQTILMLYQQEKRRLWTILTGPALCYWLLFFVAALVAKPKTFEMGSLWSLLMLLVIAAACLIFAQWQKAFTALPATIAIATAAIYIILTYQVLSPFYAYRSSVHVLPAVPQLKDTVYFYEQYSTSFPYYTGKTAVFVSQSGSITKGDNKGRAAAWQGKYLYPRETLDALALRLQQHESVSIIVPQSEYDTFVQTSCYPLTTFVGKFNAFYVFSSR